jgi:parallel beta-helix repeat protein
VDTETNTSVLNNNISSSTDSGILIYFASGMQIISNNISSHFQALYSYNLRNSNITSNILSAEDAFAIDIQSGYDSIYSNNTLIAPTHSLLYVFGSGNIFYWNEQCA